MAELQALTDRIRRAAEEKAAEILNAAKSECQEILAEAKRSGDEEAAKIAEEAKKEAERITTRAISAAAQKSAQQKLAFKMEMICSVMEKAKQSFLESENSVYMARLTKLLDSCAQKGESGELLLNKKDKTAVSPEFTAKLKEFGLTLSEKDADIEGGFILVYGKVEENCSVEAIFRENYEELVDFIGENLF